MAHNYPVMIGGELWLVSGTSASSPVMAAMISLVNSRRLLDDKGPLGWINEGLYNFSQGNNSYIQDVKVGSNQCTATCSICCRQGFSATKGWDPVTGLGSLDFSKFYKVFTGVDLPRPLSQSEESPEKDVFALTPTILYIIIGVSASLIVTFSMWLIHYYRHLCTQDANVVIPQLVSVVAPPIPAATAPYYVQNHRSQEIPIASAAYVKLGHDVQVAQPAYPIAGSATIVPATRPSTWLEL